MTLADTARCVVVGQLPRADIQRAVDCPFPAIDTYWGKWGKQPGVIVDMHAEATADKYLMGHYLDGRVTAGSARTRTLTADGRCFPGGTAFILRRRHDRPLCEHPRPQGRTRARAHHKAFVPTPFEIAEDDVRMGGAIVDIGL